jgi:hypothetical protein
VVSGFVAFVLAIVGALDRCVFVDLCGASLVRG